MSDSINISGRIERLERSNRRLKSALVVISVVLSMGILMGAAAARKVIEGERFVFRDAAGKERLTLDSTPAGPTATLMDINGKPSFKVVINKDGYFQMPTPVAPAAPAQKPPAKP